MEVFRTSCQGSEGCSIASAVYYLVPVRPRNMKELAVATHEHETDVSRLQMTYAQPQSSQGGRCERIVHISARSAYVPGMNRWS
jgi:hypothetical protein